MSYESEERLMVQGIENDMRRREPHGEIPPTHDELVKIKQDKERNKWQKELANDAFNHFKGQEILNEMRIKDYIEQWKPRGMI